MRRSAKPRPQAERPRPPSTFALPLVTVVDFWRENHVALAEREV